MRWCFYKKRRQCVKLKSSIRGRSWTIPASKSFYIINLYTILYVSAVRWDKIVKTFI